MNPADQKAPWAVFLVEFEDAEPKSGLEVTAASFFTEADLPRLSSGHDRRVSLLFRQLTGEAPVPYFDV